MSIDSTWSTSFYYEQELRSYYMNNLIKGLIKPGVYNGNIALFKKKDSQTDCLFISIKKGTTLVFLNKYHYTDKGLRKSINNTNLTNYESQPSDFDYPSLIKCVAQCDIITKISNSYPTSNKFIHAFVHYNYGVKTSTPTPYFIISEESSDTTADTALYSSTREIIGYSDLGSGELLPDGMGSDISETALGNMQYTFLLELGYVDVSNNFFTSRGMLEYRHSQGFDSYSFNPSVMLNIKDSSFKGLGIDIPCSLVGNTIVKDSDNGDLEWEKYYFNRYTTSSSSVSIGDVSSEDTEKVYADFIYGKVLDVETQSSTSERKISYGTYRKETSISSNDLVYNSITPWCLSTESEPVASVIPLDMSQINTIRLLNLAQKVNSGWSEAIDNARTSGANFSEFIPIAIIFRNGTEKINPTNMLSYFDLNGKVPRINSLNAEHNIFNVIPVME